MQLIVEIHDHEGTAHRLTLIQIPDQATISDLQKLLFKTFKIADVHQEVSNKGERIDISLGTLEAAGIKDRDTLVLKHCCIANWVLFVQFVELAKKYVDEGAEHKVIEYVKSAFDILTILEQAKFFFVYSRLCIKSMDFIDNYYQYRVNSDEQIKKAAKFYFSLFFKDDAQNPLIGITFGPKPFVGAQGGLVCSVMRSNECLGKFYLKNHLGLSIDPPRHDPIDLREVFIYELLNVLKIGPVVHFLPNVHSSVSAVYIATEEVSGFKARAEIVLPKSESYKLDIICEIFFLVDLRLNFGNYGVNMDGKLCIVDFCVGDHDIDRKGTLRSYMNSKDRIQLYKTCFEDWKLADAVSNVDEKISNGITLIREQTMGSNGSESYKTYLDRVFENIAFATQFLCPKEKGL